MEDTYLEIKENSNKDYSSKDNLTCDFINKNRVPHVWRRFFARGIDISIYSLLWNAFSNLLLRWSTEDGSNIFVFDIPLVIMIFLEPLLLSTIGTTLGKYIFGLNIRYYDGNKLNYNQGLIRCLKIFWRGYGLGIPIYSLIRLYKSFRSCNRNEAMPWDTFLSYKIKDRKVNRTIIFIATYVLLYILNNLVFLQAQMPIHRGNITAEQYYDNCNDVMSYSNIDFDKKLSPQGLWVDKSQYYRINKNNHYSRQFLPTHELTLKDGYVTGVKIEVGFNQNDYIPGLYNQKLIAVRSFLAAQKETNMISLAISNILQIIYKDFDNYSFTHGSVRVTNEVSYNGYQKSNDQLLLATEDEDRKFHMIFTLEKLN